MFVRLQKIDPEKRQNRFYRMSIDRDLFGDWRLLREWGRIGARGGQRLSEYFQSETDAERALAQLQQKKLRRGYELSVLTA